jgi:peptidoglycan/LPS O-acetylase OafA/YrhL
VTPTRDEAPAVFQPPPGNARFPLFDGVRGLAALGIVIIHCGLAVGANVGTFYGDYLIRLEVVLPFFFVTSGFLLYRPYIAGRLGVGRAPRLSSYARNRFLRIVPAYWLALTVLAIWPGLGGFWTGHTWSYYLFLMEFDRGWAFGGILQAWSLWVEITFYLLLPLIVWVMNRRSRGRPRAVVLRQQAVMVGLLLVIGAVYRIWIHRRIGHDPGSNLWAFLPGWIDHIVLGMGLAVASAAVASGERRPAFVRLVERRPIWCWVAALALFVVSAKFIGLSGDWERPASTVQWLGLHELNGLIAVGFVLPAVFGDHRSGLPRRVLGNRLVVWFGTISYGVFLYHDTLLHWLDDSELAKLWDFAPMLGLTVATLLMSTAFACASYYLVERPLLKLKRTRVTDPAPPQPAPAPVPARVGQPARTAG